MMNAQERRGWDNMAESRDLEIKRDQEGICDRKLPPCLGD
jgi:hypothetical protein